MISHIQGTIIHTWQNAFTIDVGGIGYKVFVPTHVLHATTETAKLWVHTAVREQSLDLYGFSDIRELEFFELLLTISGIGPKSALGIMSVAPLDVLLSAIVTGNSTYLTKVSGIGAKSAAKIMLELKDKVHHLQTDEVFEQTDADALDALTALGYSLAEAREAIKQLPQEVKTTNDKIREALKILGS